MKVMRLYNVQINYVKKVYPPVERIFGEVFTKYWRKWWNLTKTKGGHSRSMGWCTITSQSYRAPTRPRVGHRTRMSGSEKKRFLYKTRHPSASTIYWSKGRTVLPYVGSSDMFGHQSRRVLHPLSPIEADKYSTTVELSPEEVGLRETSPLSDQRRSRWSKRVLLKVLSVNLVLTV